MCGLTGFWQAKPFRPDTAERIAEGMALQIAVRGPDDAGVWVDADAGIVLAHRRLSILDLSQAGHQPMFSPSGRFVITFNGEIYNHLDLRRELDGRLSQNAWRGHSDTETLLAGFDVWGVEETVKKSIGMFACALWDRARRLLYLVRDRMGEKPLYYGWQSDVFLFASELKALRAHPDFLNDVDRDSLTSFLRYNYIPAPHSIYRGIRKLPPGTILTVPLDERNIRPSTPEPVAYWSLMDAAARGMEDPFAGTETEAVSALEKLLKSAIGMQMIADVPLGAFLSGGVDSSTVVALMQSLSNRPVKTFTIGFHQSRYNEAHEAHAIARHLGTEHTELYVTPDVAKNVIPLLPELYDEPFADSSQIPTFLVAQLARQHVTVSLSGDAGDELFGGYGRYFLAPAIWRNIRWAPAAVRQFTARVINSVPASVWNGIGSVVRFNVAGTHPERLLAGRTAKAADLLRSKDGEELYLRIISNWRRPADLVIDSAEPATIFEARDRWPDTSELPNSMMYLDGMTYLPDDILVKVDRAAMGVSLETRVPLLDHRVVEYAWKLPLSYKIRDGEGKWILRQVLHKYVPKELTDRPKMGFGVPIEDWIRGPLRDWAEGLLDDRRLRREGFLQPGPIREKWQQHLSRQCDWQTHIWAFLMFQSWLERHSAPLPKCAPQPPVFTLR